jgi:hypothetical protein
VIYFNSHFNYYISSEAGETLLKIYDLLGNEVTSLINEEKPIGLYQISFDASPLPSGVYMCRLTSGINMISKKMILAK